ncbi:Clp protease N-terminal domain-containing protein [Sphaerisporangium sp. TRM90804]|uniref:Clp protease N-terminal domain-containing protein n=1 Tax=Sphaerisporangium sp. TRM90804 TaxID=3031113 RepID=UPI00244794B2|nr:Clp protease N-terminal domain-containing protein [Sphaerisporangium sp. TRM90804]MDH2427896.1 Clp protease N-terminal domain-containing protein [Sphaerisporangium sp. TRM90804]
MPKINVYLPDDLADAVKEAGVPVSAVCQRALEQAVRRVTAIRATTLGDLGTGDPTAGLAHFTARARTVLKLAVEQARADSAPDVGTEHLLGALLAEGSNVALHVLRAVEIEPAQVGRNLALRSAQTTDDQDAARHFSTPAANALELTVTEATALGHNYIGCEHLLLGLVTEPDGTAGQVLRALGAEPKATRRAVVAWLSGYIHLRTQDEQAAAGGTPLPEGAAKALAAAVRQELQPLLQRVERLEERLDMTSDG